MPTSYWATPKHALAAACAAAFSDPLWARLVAEAAATAALAGGDVHTYTAAMALAGVL
jgi:hypothetical protein